MNENDLTIHKKGSIRLVIIILILVLLALAGFGGWYFLTKKSAEGGACNSNSKCENGLTCANKICSSGKVGSTCENKNGCKTGYCVNGKCTEGKVADVCSTYKDCASGLYCKQGTCTMPPDYTKYFGSIKISKIKPGSGPGVDNPEIATTTFTSADAIEIDFIGVKSTTVGDFYYEAVNSSTGELAISGKDREGIQQFKGQDRGVGTDLSNVSAGTYDLNIYFKNELVYTTQITVTEKS